MFRRQKKKKEEKSIEDEQNTLIMGILEDIKIKNRILGGMQSQIQALEKKVNALEESYKEETPK
jgi:hypothetical protein